MRIHIATDHAGLEFSTQLQHHLAEQGHDVVDHGPIEFDPLDNDAPGAETAPLTQAPSSSRRRQRPTTAPKYIPSVR